MTASDAHDHGHDPGHDHPPATRRGYATGFAIACVLTALPFRLVMGGPVLAPQATAMAIAAIAVVQIAVHVGFFLHLDARTEGGWSLMAFVFTAVVVGIAVGGSVWIMYHLNTNMMPMAPTE